MPDPAVSRTVVLRPTSPRPHPLAELAALLGPPAPADAPTVTGVSHVAQSVCPGDLYVARQGGRAHGAEFCTQAAGRGAVAVLTDPAGTDRAVAAGLPVLTVPDPAAVLGTVARWVYDAPSEAMTLIGITGTSGKTTTAYLLEAGLRACGHVTGLLGTVETRIAGAVLGSARTTPEAPELQALLALMLERGVTAAAMEVSSHALALGRAEGLSFAAGLFTNFSQDHLDFHTDMEDYFAAKARLFDGRAGAEVVNVDDEWARRLVHARTVTVSAGGTDATSTGGTDATSTGGTDATSTGGMDATWRAERIVASDTGASTFTAVGPEDIRVDVALDLPGAFNAANALLALATLHAVGADPAVAATGLRHVQVPGRLERVEAGDGAGQDFAAFVDYAHKPGAVAAILAALRPLTKGALIVVLGAGGDRDRAKRPVMGEAAARGADLVVVTDDNPRGEDPAAIRAEIGAGAARVPGAAWVTVPGRRAAIAEAVRRARPGDIVVVAGKGHEQGQEVAGTVHPFDDRAVLREVVAERPAAR